jgi:outer membrane lipoprotein-sorting protein
MVPIHPHLAAARLTRRLVYRRRLLRKRLANPCPALQSGERSTFNIQRSTSKEGTEWSALNVQSWALNVECFLRGSGAQCVNISEESLPGAAGCRVALALVACALLFLSAAGLRAGDYDAEFSRWFEVQTNLQSWSGDFTQTRKLTVLNQPLVTAGKVWVKRGEFRWELGQPPQTIVLRRPDELLIIYPRFKRAEKYPLGAVPSGPMKDALALLDASLPRDRASMEEHFKLVSAAVTNSILQMTLQPRSEAARKMIGEVVIGFRTNDYVIASTAMKFGDGSALQNTFTNVVLNQPLPPELFDAPLPADYTVTEPLKP